MRESAYKKALLTSRKKSSLVKDLAIKLGLIHTSNSQPLDEQPYQWNKKF